MRLDARHVLALGAALVGVGLVRSLSRKRWTSSIDDYATMEPETECDPTPKPGVIAFRDYVLAHYGGTDLGIIRECGGSLSGHTAGRAWDWGTLSNGAQVSKLLDDLQANGNELFRRAGLMYMIWNGRIWNTRSQAWQNYTGPNPHTDHVHFSFSREGAAAQTSFYTEPRIV